MFRQGSRFKQKSTKHRKILVLALLILLIGGGAAWALTRPENTTPSVPRSDTTSKTNQQVKTNGGKVDLKPATEAQQNAARDNPSSPGAVGANNKRAVTPFITSATAQEVRAYVNGVVEDDGNCTATYSHGPDTVTATSSGIGDVNHTTCGPMTLQGPVNISGDWTVVVTYNSAGYSGKSDPKTFKVQ